MFALRRFRETQPRPFCQNQRFAHVNQNIDINKSNQEINRFSMSLGFIATWVIGLKLLKICWSFVLASFPQPLHLPDDLWMSSSKASALVQSLRSDLQTAHTAFWGRKHSLRQLSQNLTVQWESKSVTWELPECHAACKVFYTRNKTESSPPVPFAFLNHCFTQQTTHDMKWHVKQAWHLSDLI